MKPTALSIERWLSHVEAKVVPPPQRKCLQVIVHEAAEEDKERVLSELVAAGRTVEDIHWSDDMAAAQAKALAEHIAAHPEDAGHTVANFNWVVWEIVWRPQELIEDEHIAVDTDKDATVSETPDNVLLMPNLDCSTRSKPWRPVH
jgi:hypothetical protein